MDIVKRLKAKPPKGFVTSPLMIEAADEIERLQLREETLSGIIDGMTARFIEAQGAVEEIERLREENKRLGEIATDAVGWMPPASVNGPREEYQNEIKELTDGYC